MSRAAVRCEQPNGNRKTTPVHQQESGHLTYKVANAHHTRHTTKKPTPNEAAMGSGQAKSLKPSGVSRDNASKEGTMLTVPPSLTQELDRVFTQRPL
jgi:hypothetical protein